MTTRSIFRALARDWWAYGLLACAAALPPLDLHEARPGAVTVQYYDCSLNPFICWANATCQSASNWTCSTFNMGVPWTCVDFDGDGCYCCYQ